VFFPIAITLHNLEEALWLPQWSRHAKRFHKPVQPNEFFLAVILVTLLASLSTFVAIAAPSFWLGRQLFFGFLGAMILNAFMPHLAATILLRRYAPGLITGLALLVPINLTIIIQAMTAGELSWWGLIISTIVVAGLWLSLLPAFLRLGRLLIK
jgi:hypothetical protein